jgi:molybdopterin converting factor small subunit
LRVGVYFYGFVRDVIGTRGIALDVPKGSTVRDLLDLLVAQAGKNLRDRLLRSSGDLETNVRIFVGGRSVTSLAEPLGDDGQPSAEVKVFVLSATAGG